MNIFFSRFLLTIILTKPTLSGHICKVIASHGEGCKVDSCWSFTDLRYARGAQGVLPFWVGVRRTSSNVEHFSLVLSLLNFCTINT